MRRSFKLDYLGFLTTAASSVKTTAFTYNAGGQIASEQATLTGVSGTLTTSYNYDYDNRLTSLTYPSGRVVSRSYQASGGAATDRLNTIVDNTTSTTLVQGVQDNPAGEVTSRTLSNISETRTFNTRNQLTGISATLNTAGLLGLTYDYGTTNNIGRIRTRTDSVQADQSVAYTYDGMNRLTQVAAANGSWAIAWTLDAWGNRTAQTPSGSATSVVGTQTLGYSNNRNTLLTYDSAGNVTNDGVHNYAYDAEGRITSVDVGTVTYTYDTEGRRVKRADSSGATYYIYGQVGLMSEFTTTNTNATRAASTDQLSYFVSEATGTPVLVLDGTGTVLENNRVLPFGELWSPETGSQNEQKFTNYLRDSLTSVDYAMARYYTSSFGGFMRPDAFPGHPTNPQSWNRYVYGLDDPINNTDPTGMTCVYNNEDPDHPVGDNGDSAGCLQVGVSPGDPNGPNTITPQQVYVTADPGSWFDYLWATMFNQIPQNYSNDVAANKCQPPLICNAPTPTATLKRPPKRGPQPLSFLDKTGLVIACIAGMDPEFAKPMGESPRPADSTDATNTTEGQGPPFGLNKSGRSVPYGGSPEVPNGAAGGAAYGAGVGQCITNVFTAWPK